MVLALSYSNVNAMFLYKLAIATYNKYRKSLVANTNVSETLKMCIGGTISLLSLSNTLFTSTHNIELCTERFADFTLHLLDLFNPLGVDVDHIEVEDIKVEKVDPRDDEDEVVDGQDWDGEDDQPHNSANDEDRSQ